MTPGPLLVNANSRPAVLPPRRRGDPPPGGSPDRPCRDRHRAGAHLPRARSAAFRAMSRFTRARSSWSVSREVCSAAFPVTCRFA
jgi:hypothetical protein